MIQQCVECGKNVATSPSGICIACLVNFVQTLANSANTSPVSWWLNSQPIGIPITPWHSYDAKTYKAIKYWIENYESTRAMRVLGYFEDAVLKEPIISQFDSETFSYILDWAIGVKDSLPDAAYLVFIELERKAEFYKKSRLKPS